MDVIGKGVFSIYTPTMAEIHALSGTVRCSCLRWLPPLFAILLTLGSIASRGEETRLIAMQVSSGGGHEGVKPNDNSGQASNSPARLVADSRLDRAKDSRDLHRLEIRAHFRPDSHTLVVEVSNPETHLVRLVRPRPMLLMQSGEWAGWRVSVMAGGARYLPVPPPGASIPATLDDIITLGLHESFSVEIVLAKWQKSVAGVALMHGSFLMEEKSKVIAEISWSSAPSYLRIEDMADPAAASARR